jgi:hypothetical protein
MHQPRRLAIEPVHEKGIALERQFRDPQQRTVVTFLCSLRE